MQKTIDKTGFLCYTENENEYQFQFMEGGERMSISPERLFGRTRIFYDDIEITRDNVREIVSNIMPVHMKNAAEIQKLYSIFKGNQAILRKQKVVTPEINNQICLNMANQIVTFKTGYLLGKPIQYVSRGERTVEISDEVSQEIDMLNRFASDCDKAAKDVELAEWFHICGTSYRYINVDADAADGESPFEIFTLDPRFTSVVYSNGIGNKPLFAVQVSKKRRGEKIINVWTKNKLFKIREKSGERPIVTEEEHPLGRVPVIEYPANNARLGSFEIVLSLLDAINAAFSDLADGREQFINALLVLKGVDIKDEHFKRLKEEGGILCPPDGDVKYLVSELNQSQNCETINLMIDTMLEIVGMPKRSGSSGGTSDNGIAVILRDGFADAEARASDTERIFKKSENELLRIALRICNAKRDMKLQLASVEPHFTRQNTDNLLAKVQALTTMLASDKIHPRLAWQLSTLVSDPESAYMISQEYEEQRIEEEEKQLAETTPSQDNIGGDVA